jgi:hypothetical protein
MVLAYGADNGPLLHLIGEVLRVVAPRGGEWLEDDAALRDMAVGLVHFLRQLRAPDDGTMASEGVEKRIDDLLFDLGYDGSEWGHGADQSPRARWAAKKRGQFGIYGPLLMRYREAVTRVLLEQPPREMPRPEPSAQESWDRIIAEINARRGAKDDGDA